MAKGTPVRINNSGELAFVNVSTESEATNIAGITNEEILSGNSGNFVSSGKITNITTTANFGDVMYIDKFGGLTNVAPVAGQNSFVEGDFVITAGVVAKNIDNALNKDLIINIDIVGQL